MTRNSYDYFIGGRFPFMIAASDSNREWMMSRKSFIFRILCSGTMIIGICGNAILRTEEVWPFSGEKSTAGGIFLPVKRVKCSIEFQFNAASTFPEDLSNGEFNLRDGEWCEAGGCDGRGAAVVGGVARGVGIARDAFWLWGRRVRGVQCIG